MKTTRFSATVGTVAGYFHNDQGETPFEAAHAVASLWQKHAKDVFTETGVYVSAIFSPALCAYHQDWGCPEGGEQVIAISGEKNPYYGTAEQYPIAVREVLKRVATELQQSTSQITFQECDFFYLDARERDNWI